jgi:hypothetical protein
MAELIQQFKEPVERGDARYVVRVYGEQRRDGRWSGWLEFHPILDTQPILRTAQETTQPDRGSLALWASGLELFYFTHALERARQVA